MAICYYGVFQPRWNSSSQTTEFAPRFRSAQATDCGVLQPTGAGILPRCRFFATYHGVFQPRWNSSSQTTEFAPRFRSAQATSTRLKYSIARFFLLHSEILSFASIDTVNAVHKISQASTRQNVRPGGLKHSIARFILRTAFASIDTVNAVHKISQASTRQNVRPGGLKHSIARFALRTAFASIDTVNAVHKSSQTSTRQNVRLRWIEVLHSEILSANCVRKH